LKKTNDRYVFPSQCEQVFYSKVPGKRDWSFVVRYDPRGRPVKYTIDEEDDIEEEDDVLELEQVRLKQMIIVCRVMIKNNGQILQNEKAIHRV
jgi:hypothetical protein